MTMKTDIKTNWIVRLILAAGILLLFTWNVQAEPSLIKTEEEVKGHLEIGEKETSLLAVGDRVKILFDKEVAVMPGDRMEIYEPTKTGMEDEKGNKILAHVGRLVITDVSDTKVIGKLEQASKELFVGSYVDYSLPENLQADRYSGYFKTLVNTYLKDPERDSIKVAIMDVNDEEGNITRLSEDVFKEFSTSLCGRPQFTCVKREELLSLLQVHDIPTSRGVGRYLRRKLFQKNGALLLITASIKPEAKKGENLLINVATYDLKDDRKMQDIAIIAPKKEFATKAEDDEIIVKNRDAKQGLLKITLNRKAPLNGRRVDNLFMIPLEDFVPKNQWKYIPESILNVEVQLDGKVLKPSDQGTLYYNDIINGGHHSLLLSVTPTIQGKSELPLSRAIDKTILLNVPGDVGTETEIVLKIFGKQAIVVVDSNRIKEQALLPIDIQ
ncbi:MAG: hypothetical protein HZA04_10170 [Nitrospinae bacterium]|nr:hypothetical protein [Nitrospinota bacterium]